MTKLQHFILSLPWLRWVSALACMLILWSCAQTGQLAGGPKDVTPPKIDTLTSSKSGLTNQHPKQLVFNFDEFIKVKDVNKEILISPSLTYLPVVKERGKKLTVSFDPKEVLKSDVTYTIQFGNAIEDFREGNTYKNFKYVFATGDILDSLSLSGSIADALTGKPQEDVLVFLYDQLTDSIVAQKKPYYSTRTNKEGKFVFDNIRSDTFKLFAIKDANLNYLFDLPTEQIAFSDSLVNVAPGSRPEVAMILSKPEGKLAISTVNTKTFGKVNIAFNKKPSVMPYSVSPDSVLVYPEVVQDSINFWYNTRDSFLLQIPGLDTIKVNPRVPKDFAKRNKFRVASSNFNQQMLANDTAVVEFNQSVTSVDRRFWLLEDDIGPIDSFDLVFDASRKKINIIYQWVDGVEYQLTIDSAACRSLHGFVNDSIGFKGKFLTDAQKGTLVATVIDLDSTKQYYVKVMRNDKFVYGTQITNASKKEIKLKGLVPDRYDFEIIQDVNQNKQWDAVDYWNHRQPEVFKQVKGDKIRENWESNFSLSWKTGTIINANEPILPPTGLEPGIRRNNKN